MQESAKSTPITATMVATMIVAIPTPRGKKNVITFRIEAGLLDTDHPSGQETHYNLEDSNGHVYRVIKTEIYSKHHATSAGIGDYVSFYFPLDGPHPSVGDVLTALP